MMMIVSRTLSWLLAESPPKEPEEEEEDEEK